MVGGMNKTPVSVVVLTFNEEANIRFCLESVRDLTDEIFIVDSFSTDKTLEIAQEYTDKIYQHPWTHYAGQRQWALANLPFAHEWLFFLDADERLTAPLRQEIGRVAREETKNPAIGGYYVPRKFFFLGRQLRWGGCQGGLKELRLCHRQYLTIGERAGHEIYIIQGKTGTLKERLVHEDKKPLSAWIDRHNHYATINGAYLFSLRHGQAGPIEGLSRGASDRRLYWKEVFRWKVWNRLPIGLRPAIYFLHNYFLRLGFLDGKAGFLYIFLHDFWYQLLIDAKYLELCRTKIGGGGELE